MSADSFIPIGKVRKPHGLKGALKVHVDEAYEAIFPALSVVFIEQGGQPLPFFMKEVQVGADVILHLEDIQTKEATTPLKGKTLFVRPSDLAPWGGIEAFNEQEGLSSLIGFRISDMALGGLGEIKDIVEMPMHQLAIIEYQKRDCYIPLHEHLIKSIDQENAIIHMDLPEGLMDLA